ncbi:hypothetical protein [Kaistia terrae]|uniref:DNA injection protein n=1 Tax=Kaistia terrae TaxID=537017 RepID=A0ABW0Q2E8_9HYPH|nr:hypothetical protein [Kaistia terrae]MCX5581492.1 hypothetical protein [Kaistia terrae]
MAATTTQTNTNDAWKTLQPYMSGFLQDAKTKYQEGQWGKPYAGSTVVPFAQQTTDALGQIQGIAGQGDQLNQAAMNNAQGVLSSGGMSDWQKGALGGAYDVATGANRVNTEGQLQGLLNSNNDNFNAVLDKQAGAMTNDIGRSFSNAGRYGSAAMTGAITDQVGDFRQKAASDHYDQQMAQQAGLLNQIGQVQGTNIANQVGAGQAINNAGNQAQQLAAGYSAMSPALYAQQYAGADRLASVGNQYEDLSTRTMQDQLDKWNANQNLSLNQLQQYGGLLGVGTGMSGAANTSSSVKAPTNYGAIAGAVGTGLSLAKDLFGSAGSSAVTGGLW